jgi:hypothetical protein
MPALFYLSLILKRTIEGGERRQRPTLRRENPEKNA